MIKLIFIPAWSMRILMLPASLTESEQKLAVVVFDGLNAEGKFYFVAIIEVKLNQCFTVNLI